MLRNNLSTGSTTSFSHRWTSRSPCSCHHLLNVHLACSLRQKYSSPVTINVYMTIYSNQLEVNLKAPTTQNLQEEENVPFMISKKWTIASLHKVSPSRTTKAFPSYLNTLPPLCCIVPSHSRKLLFREWLLACITSGLLGIKEASTHLGQLGAYPSQWCLLEISLTCSVL